MNRVFIFCGVLFASTIGQGFDADPRAPLGKNPEAQEIHAEVPPTGDLVGKLPTSDSLDERLPNGPAQPSSPPPPLRPLTTLQDAVHFILNQRGMGGQGLPATFAVPPQVVMDDPLRQLIVSEGVGLYDTSLAVITLVEAGRLADARQILDFYVSGVYAPQNPNPLELGAYPTIDNNNAFLPFNSNAHYFFDFTNVYGSWFRWGPRWKFWTAHTGPNAWLINALVRYIDAARKKGATAEALAPYQQLAEVIGQGLLQLQDPEAYGGVRYAPRDTYHAEGLSDPFWEINSENNISSYVALHMLAHLTGNPTYAQAAHRILVWFRDGPVWTADGEARHGLWDIASGTLAMGAVRQGGRWVLQRDHATDSGGTWTISALGPAKIDELWGSGAAYRMWQAVRARSGRTADYQYISPGAVLAGLDYNDAYPANESLISPEWTAGGLFAVRELLRYYDTPHALLNTEQLAGLRRDAAQMAAFIRQHSTAYAWGPGHRGLRQGQTGFHWFSPPPEVQAMASVYVALYLDGRADPNGWWRKAAEPPLKLQDVALLEVPLRHVKTR